MRVLGWPRLLNEYILETQKRYQREGFVWGRIDCVHFVGEWVKIATGEDYLSGHNYSTKGEADALLEKEGSLYQALVSRLGEPIHPAKAQRGDIAYRKDENACGIYFTSGAYMMALFLGEGGF